MKTEHQVVAVWNLNYLCNLECPYCFFALEKRKNPDNNRFGDTDKVIDFFNKTGRKFLIRLCGGEPFLYPDFIGLCRALTEKNQISVSSNLTGNLLYDFSERINPESVEMIDCSLHIVERERLNLKDDFCEKVNHLKQKKFHLRVTQVMYPPAIKEFDRTFDYFNKRGITIIPVVFRGEYKGRYYPQSYTPGEKEKILSYLKNESADETFIRENQRLVDGDLSFRGLPCSAGRKFIRIDFDGTIKKCPGDNKCLGNIYEGRVKFLSYDETCNLEICRCPYHGLRYASGNPEIIIKPAKSFWERVVYPVTTPLLKPARKWLQ